MPNGQSTHEFGTCLGARLVLAMEIAANVRGITKWLFGFGLTCEDANGVRSEEHTS